MSEFKTIEERYGSAVEASDLTLRFERGGPVDTLTAAGMVGVKNPLSLSIWRLVYGQDQNERHVVLAGLVHWMKVQRDKRAWDDRSKLVNVTVVVADWYQDRVCKTCNGTRYETIPGTPTLSDVPCPSCHGSGERSLDKLLVQFGPKWIGRGKDLRAHMDDLVSQAAAGMLRKIRNSIEECGL